MGAERDNSRKGRGGKVSGGAIAARLAAALALLALLCWGAYAAFSRMRESWISQCVVTDVAAQVEVRPSPHVSPEVVRGLFGLTNGCNLALVDFEGLREKALREQPIIKALEIVRRLPGRVEISVEERKPIARVNYSTTKVKTASGHAVEIGRWDVIDADGVVFNYNTRDSKLLPRIVEPKPSAKKGERLAGRSLSAARLVELGLRKEYAPLRVRDVVVTNATYLVAATENYDIINIAWNFVDDPEEKEQPHLENALKRIREIKEFEAGAALRNEFTVTEFDRVTAKPYDREPPTR